MANITNVNPWVIDTAGATNLTTDEVRVKEIRWVSLTAAAGDHAVVKDKNGNVVWESYATGPGYVEADNLGGQGFPRWQGLAVTTLASGKLYVYFQ